MRPTVLLAGGGTGGHVFPALAVAAALAAPGDLDVAFVGTERGLEARLVPAAGFPLHTVAVLPLARRLSPALARVPVALLRSVGQVGRLVRARDVVAAAAFGGYVSLPLALAARRAGIPYVVHEQNAVPGLANRIAGRAAAAVAVTYPSSASRFRGRRMAVTGNPVRPGLEVRDPAALRREALEHFDLDPGRRTLLVFGGSQGARRINTAVIDSLVRWPAPERLQVLHASGRGAHPQIRDAWHAAEAAVPAGTVVPVVRCVDFVDRMDLAYAAADAVVCRAGASTIAELTVIGRAAVLVPYPHATDDHQAANAAELAAAGAAVVVRDANLDGAALVAAAGPLLADPARRDRTAAAAVALGRPDAAHRVAALVREVAGLPAAPPVTDAVPADPSTVPPPPENGP